MCFPRISAHADKKGLTYFGVGGWGLCAGELQTAGRGPSARVGRRKGHEESRQGIRWDTRQRRTPDNDRTPFALPAFMAFAPAFWGFSPKTPLFTIRRRIRIFDAPQQWGSGKNATEQPQCRDDDGPKDDE